MNRVPRRARTIRNGLVLAALLVSLPATRAGAQAKPTATFAGTVVDSLQRPISNADVSLPGLSMNATTNDKGAFQLLDIPAGVHRVLVRRIGYSVLDTVIGFPEGQVVGRRITMGRIVTIDSVVVEARAVPTDPMMVEFEENRARGMGHFVTRAELEKAEGRSLSSVMQMISGVGIVRGNQGQGWIVSKRAPMSGCPPSSGPARDAAAQKAAQEATDRCLRSEHVYYVPDQGEARTGMNRSCYAVVYADRMMMNGGKPTVPFDLNTFSPDRIEAIEWYETASSAPARYNAPNALCGLAILHLRKR